MMKKQFIKYYLLLRNAPMLFVKPPMILSFEKTVAEIAEGKKSFARFGDGEIRMMMNEGSIGFQNKNSVLTKRLWEVMLSDEKNFMIGLPNTFHTCSKNTLDSQIFWLGFNMKYAKKFLSSIPQKSCGDATITRFYLAYKDKTNKKMIQKVKLLQRIWENKNLLIIEGEHTKLGINNDFFNNAGEIKRIICPAKNAFDIYDKILENAKAYAKDRLIFLALGPTATVLAYDLCKAGFWAVDIGHIDIEYSWFLEGRTSKTSVQGKFVNEAVDQISHDEPFNDENYEKSILTRLL